MAPHSNSDRTENEMVSSDWLNSVREGSLIMQEGGCRWLESRGNRQVGLGMITRGFRVKGSDSFHRFVEKLD
jgi:hypothetical protein